MKPQKATTAILALIASGSLAVDASVFDGKNLDPITETIAAEQVEVIQKGNIVEAKAPWKGEEGLTIKYDMGEPTLDERIRDRRSREVIYERVDFGKGGFKVDILLTERPDTNLFCYTIEGADQYDFFFQPPLTPEEKAQRKHRAPEIEGSYAVYHKTLKNHEVGETNYATGKVMHIPRPQVWELGNEEGKVWADLSYSNGNLCVTVPQDFLDNADYTNGVRVDPTFGYTSIGVSSAFSSYRSAGTYFVYKTAIRIAPYVHGTVNSVSVALCGGNAVGNCTNSTTTVLGASVNLSGATSGTTYIPTVAFGESSVTIASSSAFYTVTASSSVNEVYKTKSYALTLITNPVALADESTVLYRYDSGTPQVVFGTEFNGANADIVYSNSKVDRFDINISGTDIISIYATYTTINENTIDMDNGIIKINYGNIKI